MYKRTIFALLCFLPLLSGCVVIDFFDDVSSAIEGPQKYEWQKITIEETFGWLDVVNEEMAKVGDYPIYIRNDTRYLNIYFSVEFSNPLNPKLGFFNQGRLNFTIVFPSGENITKTYCTTAKSKTYEEHFNFPTSGDREEWFCIVRVIGYGKYKIVAQTYEPV